MKVVRLLTHHSSQFLANTMANVSPKLNLSGSKPSKIYQALPIKVDPGATKLKINASFGAHLLKDQFSITTWLSFGAVIQTILFLTVKPSYATLPVIGFAIWTIGSLLRSVSTPNTADPNITYHKTTALLPSSTGEHRSGTSGEKIAVLHLALKNYSPLGPLSPAYRKMIEFAPTMMAELDSPAGREKYGFLGSDTYLQTSSPVSTSASTLMFIMYFRSLEGVHTYSQSELHRKGWDWYHNSTKGEGMANKTLGIMHEVFEAPAGKWETVHVNMEKVGLSRASVRLDNGSQVETLVDARKAPLATAKGRIS